jgi:hypothetical protein
MIKTNWQVEFVPIRRMLDGSIEGIMRFPGGEAKGKRKIDHLVATGGRAEMDRVLSGLPVQKVDEPAFGC